MKSSSLVRVVTAFCCALAGVGHAASPPAGAVPFPKFGNPLQFTPHHLTASVANVDRAVEWYRTMLGFEVLEKGLLGENKTPYAEMRIATFGIAFVQARSEPQVVEPGKAIVPRWIHIVFSVPDPQATFDLLKARGVDVHTRGSTNPVTEFQFRDSEGNEIEIGKLGNP